MSPRAFKSMLWGWNKIKPFWCGAGDSWLSLLAPEWVGAMPVACSGALPRAELPWPPRKRFEGTPSLPARLGKTTPLPLRCWGSSFPSNLPSSTSFWALRSVALHSVTRPAFSNHDGSRSDLRIEIGKGERKNHWRETMRVRNTWNNNFFPEWEKAAV